MNLSRNFTLQELIKSDTAIRMNINNNPSSGQIEKMQLQLESNVHTGVMLDQHGKDLEKLKKDIEKLKDATRDIKFANGNGSH